MDSGNAVRGEDRVRPAANVRRQPVHRGAHVARIGFDEERMVEPAGNVGDVDVATRLSAERRAGSRHVLAVLLAAGVAVVRRRDESDRTPCTCAPHLLERVVEQRVPVAHPDEDRQRPAGGLEALLKAFGLAFRELGDGRHSAEHLVVMRDLFDPFRTDAPAAQHALQKRAYVGKTIGSTKRDNEYGIEQGNGREPRTCPLGHSCPGERCVQACPAFPRARSLCNRDQRVRSSGARWVTRMPTLPWATSSCAVMIIF